MLTSMFLLSIFLVVLIVFLSFGNFLIKRGHNNELISYAFLMFVVPFFSIYYTGMVTDWSFSGDAFWNRVFLFFLLDIPTLIVLFRIFVFYLRKYDNKGKIVYIVILAILIIGRTIFHIYPNEKFVYFEFRNIFGPTIYDQKHPYEVNSSSKDFDFKLLELGKNQSEKRLLKAYAQAIRDIANKTDNKVINKLMQRRWYLYLCISDAMDNYKYPNDVLKITNKIKFSILNNYQKEKKFSDAEMYYDTHYFSDPDFSKYCKNPSKEKIDKFFEHLP